MLESQQVSAMTYNLLGSSEAYLYQGNLNNPLAAQQKEEQIKLALLSATQGKPVALQLANDSHWITLCLLRDKSDQSKINLVMMDGKAKDQVGELQVDGLTQIERQDLEKNTQVTQRHLNPGQTVNNLEKLGCQLGVTVSELYDMSVEGQQYDNSCGLDTALKTAAIIKTHENYEGKFNYETFKQALDPNVYYHKQKGQYYICGQQSSLSQGDIVKEIGNNLLLRSLEDPNYNKPEGTIQDFLKGLESNNKPSHSSVDGSNGTIVVNNGQKNALSPESLKTYHDTSSNKELLAQPIEIAAYHSQFIEKKKDNSNVKAADPDKDISLGLINGFIVWLAKLVDWLICKLFGIVNNHAEAQTAEVKTWVAKIQSPIQQKTPTSLIKKG